jgi:Uma2 family endonuclease
MAVKTLISWQEFENLPDDGFHKELLEGELVTLPPPKSGHSDISHNIFEALHSFVKPRKLGRVYIEAGYRLPTDPSTWIQPDVSFLRASRKSQTLPAAYFEGAPDLSIEVISPSESARDVERKTDLCLAHGSTAVWVIYPEDRILRVYQAGTSFEE